MISYPMRRVLRRIPYDGRHSLGRYGEAALECGHTIRVDRPKDRDGDAMRCWMCPLIHEHEPIYGASVSNRRGRQRRDDDAE